MAITAQRIYLLPHKFRYFRTRKITDEIYAHFLRAKMPCSEAKYKHSDMYYFKQIRKLSWL